MDMHRSQVGCCLS